MTLDSRPSLDDIPGRPGWPIIGSLPSLVPNPMPYVEELQRRYGNVFFVDFGMKRRVIYLLGPDAAELVLLNRNEGFSNALAYGGQARVLGDRGLLFADGADHRSLRRRMNPALLPRALRGHLKSVQAQIVRRVATWSAGPQPSIADEIRNLTLDIVGQVIVGADRVSEGDTVTEHCREMLTASGNPLPAFPGTAKWKAIQARAHLDRYFREQIAQRRAGAGSGVFSAICSQSLEQGLTDDEIVHNMIGLIAAAYETTAVTLMMMVYFLARHPRWQERLRTEFAGAQSLGELRFEALEEMVEVEWVLKETLRLNSPLPFLPRKILRPFEFEGRAVPRGADVIVSPAFVHRMPSIYEAPEEFRPERFADSSAQDRVHPCAWIPFGKGSHTCIGMHLARLEVKAFFAHLLARFRIETHGDCSLRMRYAPVQGPVGAGLPIALREIRD